MLGSLISGLGGKALAPQRFLAGQVGPGKGDVLARGGEIGPGQRGGIRQRRLAGLGGGNRGIGLSDLQLERFGIDPEQQVAGLDVLVLLDEHLDNLPADLGADRHLVEVDIGIVGRNLALQAAPIDHPADQ